MTRSIEKVMGALSSAFEELDYHIQQRFIDIFPKDISKLSAGDIRSAITSRPDQVETRRIIEEAIHGSCASVAYVDGDEVYTANTGDSRSVGEYQVSLSEITSTPPSLTLFVYSGKRRQGWKMAW